jgi:hypothetical protein
MIPFNITLLLFVFILIYAIGLILSILTLIESIKDRKPIMIIISLILIILYLAFYFMLL